MRCIGTIKVAAMMMPAALGIAALTPRVHVVPFSPSHFAVRVRAARTPLGERFRDIVAAERPRLAFNGTYYGEDGKPLGILRSDGRWVFRGGRMKTVFAVDRRGRPVITTRDAVRANPAAFPFALAAGPRLLRDGRECLNPEAEGFRSASRRLRASRVALGIRLDGMAVLIVDEDAVTLSRFADTCLEAGAVDAVNLDGGGATALYHGGKVLVAPSSPMVDIVTVSERRTR